MTGVGSGSVEASHQQRWKNQLESRGQEQRSQAWRGGVPRSAVIGAFRLPAPPPPACRLGPSLPPVPSPG